MAGYDESEIEKLVDGKLPLWNDLDPGGADATTRNY